MSLQEVFQIAYDQSFYDKRLSYADPLTPPLDPDGEAWAKQRLAERGLIG